jgi:hypothetical protein
MADLEASESRFCLTRSREGAKDVALNAHSADTNCQMIAQIFSHGFYSFAASRLRVNPNAGGAR